MIGIKGLFRDSRAAVKNLVFNNQEYLHAVLKTAQYLSSLTTHEDVWRHVCKVMIKIYGAHSSGFARLGPEGEIEFHHLSTQDGMSPDFLNSDEVKNTVIEVLETGFLASCAISGPNPYLIVLLPVELESRTAAVMLVGHATDGPITNEVLNIYLTVAGLAGTTITKLSSELELKKHRAHLEELVTERTGELRSTLDRLEVQIALQTKAEAALRNYRDHLEDLVEERTHRLEQANRDLRLYSAKLERINKELQEFAFIASHDLQEPLRKIQTFADLLRIKYGGRLGDDGQDYLERMIRSAARMTALLKSLRAYSREASATSPLRPVNLAAVVGEALSDLEVLIQKADGCVELGELPTLEADAEQMRALFENLIGNSMKYCRECDKPIVKIHCRVENDECTISIDDNGLGFDEMHLDRIFRPFQRLHARNSFEGTGMGLFICRKIVERHGGTITARSMPGRGSTFLVTLPMTQAGKIPGPAPAEETDIGGVERRFSADSNSSGDN